MIGEQAYLFDARLGLEIPGPGGTGVATLEEAMTDPAILERMNLPGFLPYGTSRASLLASRTNIGILIDSGTGYFAPKMKLLERELAGKNRSMLYRDPADERDRFLHVLGARAGGVFLWSMPLEVETRLFLDQQFVLAIQSSLFLFRPEFPLLYARVKQLRGELDEAIEDYGKLRFAENAVLVTDKKTRIPPEVQDGLDVYATYFMALAQLEKKNAAAQQDEKGEAVTKAMDRAEDMFKQTLELVPEPGPNQPYYNMIRWGANANLGRIYASKKDVGRAVTYQTQRDPTPQYIGNMLRARELVWSNPMSGIVTLPPPRRPSQSSAGRHSLRPRRGIERSAFDEQFATARRTGAAFNPPPPTGIGSASYSKKSRPSLPLHRLKLRKLDDPVGIAPPSDAVVIERTAGKSHKPTRCERS